MIVYIQGAYIESNRPYIKINYSSNFNIIESDKDDALVINVRKGFKWTDIADRRITVVKDQVIERTDFIKIPTARYNLNGLVFRKTIPTRYVISQYQLNSLNDYVMLWNENQTQIFIPADNSFDINRYISLFKSHPYLEILECKNLESLYNFYGVNLGDTSINIKSFNDYVFQPKQFYTRYILRSIDIQESFISKFSSILSSIGIELKRRPIDQDSKNINRVIYNFTDIDKQLSRRSGLFPVDHVTRNSMHIDFELTTPDLPVLDDFKHRYSDLDGVTRFTTFETKDLLGNYWVSSVDWQPISTDFNSDYDQDSLGNSANKLNFSADIYYNIVYDKRYYTIQSTIIDIINKQTEYNKIKM